MDKKYLFLKYYWKIYFSHILSLYIDFIFLHIVTSNLQLVTYTLFYSTDIPDKVLKFNKFNKIIKQENSIDLNVQTLNAKVNCVNVEKSIRLFFDEMTQEITVDILHSSFMMFSLFYTMRGNC